MSLLSSFRARILGLVLAVGVMPLALLGVWLASTSVRSGEALLRDRLAQTLEQTAAGVASNWTARRSELLDLAEDDAVRAAFARDGAPAPPIGTWLQRRLHFVHRIALYDLAGTPRWAAASARAGDLPDATRPAIDVELGVHESPLGPPVGRLHAAVDARALLEPVTPTVAGMVIGAFDRETRVPLLPVPFDPALLDDSRFVLGGDVWITARRELREPAVELVAAAPLTPFTRPFEDAARRGVLLLLAVAVTGLGLALLLTRRLTRSLEQLATAADAVARGDLERRVYGAGSDELGRVARAFNAMTESLHRTLAELADQRALAAVGEFAASLAHEIRNPLTSVRVDLQRVEERIPEDDAGTRRIQARALAEIERLDATVAGALQAARSGRSVIADVDLGAVLHAAASAARPAVEQAQGRLQIEGPAHPVHVPGDAGALEQLVLNLLLNAAAAIDPGGRIDVSLREVEEAAVVVIRDDGRGIPEADLEKVFDPLYSTRPGGTGLGLAIARRLVTAHRGDITLNSRPGEGTTVTVRLPRSATAS